TNNTTEFSTGANTTMQNFGGFNATVLPAGIAGPYGPPAVNKYDPATKTFHVAFEWNPTTTTRRIEAILKYKKPRP
ncbi:MAG TPA: hypothetical protein VK483_10060, partial [Chitinophagaceae bacterium]|nr:hypothetical protein [Chitinophagaceae bacterium]